MKNKGVSIETLLVLVLSAMIIGLITGALLGVGLFNSI